MPAKIAQVALSKRRANALANQSIPEKWPMRISLFSRRELCPGRYKTTAAIYPNAPAKRQ